MTLSRNLDFLVIGAMKAGTTSLHYYLKEHPALYLPLEKEVPFFAMDALYERGMDWYLAEFFAKAGPGQLLGTVSPPYMLSDQVPERIHRALPAVKLIAILRDPISRAKSQYKMLVRAFGEKRSFGEAMDAGGQYITAGEYGRILESYLRLFPREQILVLFTNDLDTDPGAVLARVYAFLGVDARFVPQSFERRNTAGGSRAKPLARFAANFVHTYSRPIHPLIRALVPERYTRRFGKWSILYRSSVRDLSTISVTLSREQERRWARHFLVDIERLQTIVAQPVPWKKRLEAMAAEDAAR